MRKFFVFIGASILLAISCGPASSQEFAKGTLIVKFRPEVNVRNEKGIAVTGIVAIDRLNQRYGVKQAERMFGGYRRKTNEVTIKKEIIKVPSLSNIYRLRLDQNADISSAVREYESNPLVIYAEPDYIAYACATPNDPYFGEQWGLKKIQAEQAWDTTTGDTSVIIGILDTGIDTAHPDLKNNLWTNEAEYNGAPGVDDDSNGKIDDIMGWNFVSNNNDPSDGAGHGTHCAGIAGAVTDNGTGVAGVSWNSKLMAVKVLNNNGQGLYSDIAEGIVYAANNGAEVINMSLGGYVYSTLWEDALINAYATAVPIAATGNDARADSFYPACFPMVLGVAATDSFDILWDGSNHGEWVDLSAPGVAIYNTKLYDYARFTGTSEAAPFVSGVAALAASYEPDFSTGAIMSMIVNNAEPIDSLNPDYAGRLGSGRLNAYLALTGNPMPKLIVLRDTIKDPTGDGDGIPDADETVDLILILQNKGMDATGMSATLHTDDPDIMISDSIADFGDILARDESSNSADVFTFSLSDTCPQHDVLFELYVTANGGAYEDTVEFSIATQNSYNVSGVINTNTIWTRDKLYIVTNPVVVWTGVTLTIEPGTEIRVKKGKMIRIDGELIAKGDSVDTIRFTSNDTIPAPGDWYGLSFTNSSIDASYDISGNYLSGSILEYCSIEYAGPAVRCDTSAPFIHRCLIANNCYRDSSMSDTYGGGISLHYSSNCVIEENSIVANEVQQIAGAMEAYGGGIGGTDIVNLSVLDNIIENNTAEGDWEGSGTGGGIYLQMRLEIGNTLKITGNTIVNNCAKSQQCGSGLHCSGNSGPDFPYYTISDNYIGNNIGSIGSSAITLWGAGGWDSLSTIDNNVIENNLCNGIIFACGASGTISNCRIINNKGYGIYHMGTISYSVSCMNSNMIANNDSGGIKITVDASYNRIKEVSSNTVVNNHGDGIRCEKIEKMRYNNILWNSDYDVRNASSASIDADSNWWGTTNTDTIDEHLWDFMDDPMNLGMVNYTPFLTSPSRLAPPYLDSLQVYPDPVGVETLYAYLTFSKPMDTTIASEVLFAFDDTVFDTLNAYEFSGVWADSMHWNGWYLIDEMILDSTYRVRVSDARDDTFPFPIPQDTRHSFRVYTAGSVSRELIAESGTDRITLHWHPSSIPNLLGYNIYRDTTSGGPYELVNSKVITDTAYIDTIMPLNKTCYYVYTILDNNFKESSYSSEASGYIGVEERPIPVVFALSSASPNPFVDHTRIKYAIPKKTWVSLKVYDITGRLVKSLVNKQEKPGYYAVKWDSKDDEGKKPASGIYFCRLETSEYKATKKIISLH